MNTDRSDARDASGPGSSVAEQHAAIRILLDEVQGTRDLDQLLPLLDSLRTTLAEHFATEESDDGLHAMVCETAPRLESAVRQRLAEHRDFLATMDGMVRSCRATVKELATLRGDLETFVTRLLSHDQAETDMINEAVTRDIGRGA